MKWVSLRLLLIAPDHCATVLNILTGYVPIRALAQSGVMCNHIS